MTQLLIHSYDGLSGDPLETWTGWGNIEVSFDEHGPAAATVEMPRLVDGAPNTLLTAPHLLPHGAGVFLEIDATASSVPLWTGRVDGIDADGGSASVTLQLTGPGAELDATSVAAQTRVRGSMAKIAKGIIVARPDLRLTYSESSYVGRAATLDFTGQSVWQLLTGGSQDRGESFYLDSLPGRVGWQYTQTHDTGGLDLSRDVRLIEGYNCEIQPAYGLRRPITELIGVASSFTAGTRSRSVGISTVGGTVGRLSSLIALANSAIGRAVSGGPELELRPDLTTRGAMEAALRAKLQADSIPIMVAAVDVTDTSLWQYLRPGVLLGAYWPKECTGLYQNAVVRVRTVTFVPVAPQACSISVELWRA